MQVRRFARRVIEKCKGGYGLILIIGHGVSALYLDRAKVTRYVVVDPNVAMHEHIRRTAVRVGPTEGDGSLIVLGCGIEDVAAVRAALGTEGPRANMRRADTVISILTLCSVPNSRDTIRAPVRDLLKPGGVLLF